MTNVNVAVEQLLPAAGADNDGVKIGIVKSAAKAAQNDTWTVTNASLVLLAFVADDAAGVPDSSNIAANVIALDSATTGASTGFLIYR